MTEKLFYENSHLQSFQAEVTACESRNEHWAVALSATAFFPEGGGQKGDQGTINDVPVLDTIEDEGEVWHICEQPLPVGTTVQGQLDWTLRFSRMQGHSAEHILSGIAYQTWGCHNVGFHMPEKDVTLDFDRELSQEELQFLEKRANQVVWENVPVRCFFPTEEEKLQLSWRQKKELPGRLRLVEIQGVDLCACCVPHVQQTGEIGPIVLLDAMRHRGGMRITMRAGNYGLETILQQKLQATNISKLLSSPTEKLEGAVNQLLKEQETKKNQLVSAQRQYTIMRAQSLSQTDLPLVLFEDESMESVSMRELCNAAVEKAPLCIVLAGQENAWRYVLASQKQDVRPITKDMNAKLQGRGGGSAEMTQGSLQADQKQIQQYFEELKL